MFNRLFICLVVTLVCYSVGSNAQEPQSWSQAKKLAQSQWLDAGATKTLYCGCDWSPKQNGGGVIQPGCGFSNWSDKRRLTWVEWEHIVPASWLAGHMQCWKNPESIPACSGLSGRKCCESHDPVAQKRLFDPLNLAPTVGAANAARSNEPYGVIAGEDRPYGRCDFESSRQITEPRPEIRKWLGTRTLYILRRYPDAWRPQGYENLMQSWSSQ